MATKKSTAKPKTKAKSVRAVKATKSTKVTKAVKVAPKAASKKVVVSKQKRAPISLDRLNLASALVYALLAVLAVVLMKSSVYETTITYLTQNNLSNGAITGAYRHFMDIDVRWLLVILLGLSALLPALHLRTRKLHYQGYLNAKVLPWRWAEQGILQAFMVTIVALLAGFQDLVTLKLFAIVLIAVSLFSWYAEKEYLTNVKQAMRAHLLSLLAAAATVAYLSTSFLGTYLYGQVRASWYVYAAFVVLALTLLLNSLNQLNYLRGKAAYKNYEVVERRHLVISLVSKLAFAIILIVGLAK